MRVALLCFHVFALSGLIAAIDENSSNASAGNASDGNASDGNTSTNASDGNASDGNASDGNASDGNASAVAPTPAPLPAGNSTEDAAGANGSNTSGNGTDEPIGSQESMPASAGAATDAGSAEAVDEIAQDSALDAVRPPSWRTGRVSFGVVGLGVVAVAIGGLAAALSVRRGHSALPVMEEELLVE